MALYDDFRIIHRPKRSILNSSSWFLVDKPKDSTAGRISIGDIITYLEDNLAQFSIDPATEDLDKFVVFEGCEEGFQYRTGLQTWQDITHDLFTEGSVLFADADGRPSEDNANLFWAVATGLKIGTIDQEVTDVDKFLVSNAGLVKYRTGADLLTDIGGPFLKQDGSTPLTGNWDAVLNISAASITATDDFYVNTVGLSDTAAGGSGASLVGIPTITGATYTNIEQTNGLFASSGSVSDNYITDAGGITVDIAAGSGFIKATDSDIAQLLSFDWVASTGITIPTDTVRFIGVEYNGGSPQVVVRTTENWDNDSEFSLGTVVNEDDHLHIYDNPWQTTDAFSHIIERFTAGNGKVSRDRDFGGLIIGESADNNRYVTMTAGRLWSRFNKFSISAIDTSGADRFHALFRDGLSGWDLSLINQQVWDNTHYDDGTGVLATLNNNWYTNLWWYTSLDDELHMIYGQSQHATAADAEAQQPPSSVPLLIEHGGILIGRYVIKKGDTIPTEVQSAFETQFTASLAADHGNLTGLLDDDHTQYLLADGTRSLTGDWNAGAFDITIGGDLTVDTITNATGDFLTAPTGGGLITQRTAVEVLTDIGAAASSHTHILTGGDITDSGLTIGHVLTATGATTFDWQAVSGGLTGTLTENYIPVADATGNLEDSLIQDDGTSVSIGSNPNANRLFFVYDTTHTDAGYFQKGGTVTSTSAIFAVNTSTGSSNYGVSFSAQGAGQYNRGLTGFATNATIQNTGGYFRAYAFTPTATTHIGIYTIAEDATTNNYGIQALAKEATLNNYAGHFTSSASTAGTNYAGYFTASLATTDNWGVYVASGDTFLQKTILNFVDDYGSPIATTRVLVLNESDDSIEYVDYSDFGGGMTYPGLGVAISTGSAWDTSATGTANYVAKWGTGGTTLDTSLIQDNGSFASIGASPSSSGMFQVVTSTATSGFLSTNSSAIANSYAFQGHATQGTGTSTGGYFTASSSSGTNQGILVGASGSSSNKAIIASAQDVQTSNIGIEITVANGSVINKAISVTGGDTYLQALNIASVSENASPAAGTKILSLDGSNNVEWINFTGFSDSMIYPGAGIAVSTGSAWDTSATGTLNYLAKWGTAGTTIIDSQIIDDGSTLAIGTSVSATRYLNILSSLNYGIYSSNSSTDGRAVQGVATGGGGVGGYFSTTGGAGTQAWGLKAGGAGATVSNYGLSGFANESTSATNYGGIFTATGSSTNNWAIYIDAGQAYFNDEVVLNTISSYGSPIGTTKILTINETSDAIEYLNYSAFSSNVFTGSVSDTYVPYADGADIFANSTIRSDGTNTSINKVVAAGITLDIASTADNYSLKIDNSMTASGSVYGAYIYVDGTNSWNHGIYIDVSNATVENWAIFVWDGDTYLGGELLLGTVPAGTADYDKFLVLDSGGVVRYRTGTQVLSDIGGGGGGGLSDGDYGDITVSSSGTAMTIDNSAITSKTELASGLISTDELFVSDGGTLKRMDISVLEDYMQNELSFGGSYTHPNHSGHVTSAGDGATTLTVSAITGQTELTTTLISTDELLVNDGGVIKRMDISVLETYMQNELTFGSGGTFGGSVDSGYVPRASANDTFSNSPIQSSASNVGIGQPESIDSMLAITSAETYGIFMNASGTYGIYVTAGKTWLQDLYLNSLSEIAVPASTDRVLVVDVGTDSEVRYVEWQDLPSGGSSPGGSANDVQYNASGSLGGFTNIEYSSGNMMFKDQTYLIFGTTSDYKIRYDETTWDRLEIVHSGGIVRGEFSSTSTVFRSPDGTALTLGDTTFQSANPFVSGDYIQGDYLRLDETSAPTIPAGTGALYTTSSNELYFIAGDGTTYTIDKTPIPS